MEFPIDKRAIDIATDLLIKLAGHNSAFLLTLSAIYYDMAADAKNGATQCSAYLKWAEQLERMTKDDG